MHIPFSHVLCEVGIPGDDCQVMTGLSDFLAAESFQKKNVFVITRDFIADPNIFVPLNSRNLQPIALIRSKASANPQTNFFIINNCLNLGESTANLQFLSWAPEWITNPFNDYRDIDALAEKNFAGNNVWICLNNNRKVHRYLTAMYLLGNDLNRHGHLRIDPSEIGNHGSWEGWIHWWYYNDHEYIKDVENYFPNLKKGFYKLKKKIGYTATEYQPHLTDNNGCNFRQHLKAMYSKSIIEIVNETVWQPDAGGIISEKYLNSVYGKNFPILIGVKNSIQYLRSWGFDVFDDVIDHSYDEESSPTLRLVKALHCNQDRLSDFHQSKIDWIRCRARFDHNIMLAKDLEIKAKDLLRDALAMLWRPLQG